MKVLHLISSGGMYGAEAVILQLAAEMQAGGSDRSAVGVFAHAGQPPPALYRAVVALGAEAELVPCAGQMDLSVAKTLRQVVERTGAEVLHAHGYKADIYAYATFAGRRRPALVSSCHTWYDNDLAVKLYGAADRWVLRHFDQVVAVSSEVQDRLLRAGVKAARLHLIRNGIRVAVPQVDRSLREQSESFRAGLRVGLVGRLAPEKGVDVFVRAAALVADSFPEARFAVAGEGPERAALEALRRDLKLEARVELLGQQPDMGAFYASQDLLVSASRQEGLPMALLEGMAAGLPVVATRVGEVPTVVEDGRTGLLVAPESPEELAAAMGRVLGDQALRTRFGKAGRARVLEHFSAQRMTAEYLGVYRQALAGSATLRAGAEAASSS